MNILQKSLKSNAAFSFISGVLLIIIHGKIAQLFEVTNVTVFWVIGIGLVIFAATVYWESIKLRPMQVVTIIAQDLIWVIASVILLVFNPFQISFWGNVTIAGVALVVFFFAVAQSSGLSQMDSMNRQGLKKFVFERVIQASKEDVWRVISAVDAYHEVAPNIDQSKIISGSGKGMTRACSHRNEQWTETCILWNEGEAYAFEVNTKAPDYPYPLKYLTGHWQVEYLTPLQSKIVMTFEFMYTKKFHNLLIHPFMKAKFSKVCTELLDNWQRMIEE